MEGKYAIALIKLTNIPKYNELRTASNLILGQTLNLLFEVRFVQPPKPNFEPILDPLQKPVWSEKGSNLDPNLEKPNYEPTRTLQKSQTLNSTQH